MAQLDPRFGPAEQNRTVTVEYLDELYDKADELRLLKRYLATLGIDIGGFAEWCGRRSNSQMPSDSASTRSGSETIDAPSTVHSHRRAHAGLF